MSREYYFLRKNNLRFFRSHSLFLDSQEMNQKKKQPKLNVLTDQIHKNKVTRIFFNQHFAMANIYTLKDRKKPAYKRKLETLD
jgi:hypothetical protein